MNVEETSKLIANSSIRDHSALLSSLGNCCLIVTGKTAAKISGALDDTLFALQFAKIRGIIFDRITENPLVLDCMKAGQAAFEKKVDFIIGIGGGSALDAAKAAAVFAANPGLTEDDFYAQQWQCNPLPVVLVGTTAGTGSEMTNVSVLTNREGYKKSIHNDCLYARFCFSNPDYLLSVPESIAVSTALDAFAHCTESYFNIHASSVSKTYAIKGIRLLLPPLFKMLHKEKMDASERKTLYVASLLGGAAINLTGTCFPHQAGYYFTESRHVPHGFACACLLPGFLRFLRHSLPTETDEFYSAIQTNSEEIFFMIESAVPKIAELTETEVEDLMKTRDFTKGLRNTLGNPSTEILKNILIQMICQKSE